METQKQVAVYEQPKVGKYQLLKNAGYVVGATILTAPAAYAAEITTIGAGASEEINAGKALMIALFAAAAVILGVFAGWRYFKRGINSA